MERETGCKIVIRGKGAVKEGRGRVNQPSDDDELHVLVIGDDEQAVEKASKMVQKLLTPVPEEVNDHKNRQLRELAAINGTLRDEIMCRVCGQPGHRQYACPERQGAAWKPADVRCDICNSTSHPTRDCPVAKNGGKSTDDTQNGSAQLDDEYANFMAELTGQAPLNKQPQKSFEQESMRAGNPDDAGVDGEQARTSRENIASSPRHYEQASPSYREHYGYGRVRHVVSTNPKEHAREFRPHYPSQATSSPPQQHRQYPMPSHGQYPPPHMPSHAQYAQSYYPSSMPAFAPPPFLTTPPVIPDFTAPQSTSSEQQSSEYPHNYPRY